MHYHLVTFNCRYSHSCLALYHVRNELRQHLPDCRITMSQFTINSPYYTTLLTLSASTAEAFFFSAYIWNADMLARMVRDLHRVRPQSAIIIGGPQAPFLDTIPAACTIIAGPVEGLDHTFYHDLESLRLAKSYSGRSRSDFFSPYDANDFNTSLKNRQVYYESSRGCPFRCSYCLSAATTGVVHKGLAQVQEELDKILLQKPKMVKFVDRTFNDNPARALAIWQFLADRKASTKFHFEIAPDRFTEEMFSLLAGLPEDFVQFEIGIQSCNPETLAAVDRTMDIEPALANIHRLRQYDIHLHVDLILGLPFETRESFQAGFNTVFATFPNRLQMGLLKVLPQTPLRRQVADFGMIFCQHPPHEILATRWLDHQTIAELHIFGLCVEHFYNNRFFPSLWKYLKNHRIEPFHFFEKLLDHCRQNDFFDHAPTRELMSRILLACFKSREDGPLLTELLRYDWISSDHYSLPAFLENIPLPETRRRLWDTLPQSWEGLYSHEDRSRFFKQGVFLRMSGEALREIGLRADTAGGYIYLQPPTNKDHKPPQPVLLLPTSTVNRQPSTGNHP